MKKIFLIFTFLLPLSSVSMANTLSSFNECIRKFSELDMKLSPITIDMIKGQIASIPSETKLSFYSSLPKFLSDSLKKIETGEYSQVDADIAVFELNKLRLSSHEYWIHNEDLSTIYMISHVNKAYIYQNLPVPERGSELAYQLNDSVSGNTVYVEISKKHESEDYIIIQSLQPELQLEETYTITKDNEILELSESDIEVLRYNIQSLINGYDDDLELLKSSGLRYEFESIVQWCKDNV